MKDLNSMISMIGHKNLNEAEETQRKTDEQAMKAVNSLFNELFIIYPAYLPTLNKTAGEGANDTLNATKKLWLKQLQKHSITPKMLRIGITKAEDSVSSFFPTIGEFIANCHPTAEDLGIPNLEEALHEACMSRGKKPHQFTHPIVYEAGSMTGFFEIYRSATKDIKPRFKVHYETLKAKLMRGEEIEILEFAIEDQSEVKRPRTKEEKESDRLAGLEAIKKLQELFR